MSQKHCLVTGACGFIGSHLVDRLLKDGHQVIALDNLSSGSLKNLESFKKNPNLSFEEKDVTSFDGIKNVFKKVDWVFHLAGKADIVPSLNAPNDYFVTNVLGTQNVLEAARLANVKKFVYTASSTCYGIPDKYPTPESAPIRTMYPYALTKYLGELDTLHYAQVYKMPCISLRLFNVYGLRSRTSGFYGAVMGVFLKQKIAGKPFTVVGDGKQTRDFTFVSDIADAFVCAANSDVNGEYFNVGSGGTYSINRLVELLGGPVVNIPKRLGEPDCTFADISKIKKMLNWKPSVSFEKGIKIVLDNIQLWKDAPLWDPKSIQEATQAWTDYLGQDESYVKKQK